MILRGFDVTLCTSPMSKLRSLGYEDLDILADKRVVARGRECVRWGLINDLSETQGQIEALIADGQGVSCQVQIKDGARGLVTWCTCATHVDHGEICKHIIAALVAWISRRDGGASATEIQPEGEPAIKAPGTPIHDLRSVIRLVKDRARHKSGRPEPAPSPEPASSPGSSRRTFLFGSRRRGPATRTASRSHSSETEPSSPQEEIVPSAKNPIRPSL